MWNKIPGGRHTVLTDGICYRKFPFDDSPGAQELISRDANVLRFFDVWVEDVYDEEGRLGFEMGKLGFPIERIEVGKALAKLGKIEKKGYSPELGLNWVGEWSDIAEKKICESIFDEHVKNFLLGLLPRFFPVDESKCRVVCHTDVHLKNWLVDGAGRYVLIDWEYAVYGTSDVDLACLAFALATDGRLEEAIGLGEFVTNPKVWDWVIHVKAVSTASWQWSSHGLWSEVNEKVDIIDSLCFNKVDSRRHY